MPGTLTLILKFVGIYLIFKMVPGSVGQEPCSYKLQRVHKKGDPTKLIIGDAKSRECPLTLLATVS